MDWGIAKAMGVAEKPLGNPEALSDRMVQTQYGSLLGTPMYMSPEQAEGRLEAMDARSDLFSAMVVFRELMTLDHYLTGRKTLNEILEGVKSSKVPTKAEMFARGAFPGPYYHIIVKGMSQDPAARFQNADEVIEKVRRVFNGTADMQCSVTM